MFKPCVRYSYVQKARRLSKTYDVPQAIILASYISGLDADGIKAEALEFKNSSDSEKGKMMLSALSCLLESTDYAQIVSWAEDWANESHAAGLRIGFAHGLKQAAAKAGTR